MRKTFVAARRISEIVVEMIAASTLPRQLSVAAGH